MATASPQASSGSNSLSSDPSFSSGDIESATVEESAEETDLLGILRKKAWNSPHPVDSILAPVADAARVMSQADGTALALETDGLIVCRARSGSIAPGLGAVISSESGISGECLRAAAMLVCYDTETDARVDAEVCRALGIRSIAAVPLLDRARSIGILEAFSGRPNAFDGDALSSLRALADIAQTAYRREFSSARQPEPVVPVQPAPKPTVSQISVSEPPKYTQRSFTAEEITSPSGQQHRNRIWLATIVAVAVVLTVVVAWWAWHGPDETTGNPQTAHAAAIASATAQPTIREALPKPTPSVSSKRSASRPDIVLENAAELQPVDAQPSTVASAVPERSPTPTTKPASAEPMVTEAPAVTLVPTDNSQLSRLTSVEVAMPSSGPAVSQGVVEPVLIHRVDPSYPMQARTQRISGKVTLAATIGKDGIVHGVSFVNGSLILAESAKSAVRQWRYKPGTLNGKPVEIQKEITFVFALP
jgi:TonB family protein